MPDGVKRGTAGEIRGPRARLFAVWDVEAIALWRERLVTGVGEGRVIEGGGLSMAKDPVCGMTVDEKRAAATFVYQGQTYYFCAVACKDKFMKSPEKFVRPAATR